MFYWFMRHKKYKEWKINEASNVGERVRSEVKVLIMII